MTDFVWQPFVLRRTTHGDVLRSASTVQAALRYGPPTFAWDIVKGTTLTGRSQDYNALIIDVQVPPSVPNRGEMVLVRGGFGYPTTPMDGVAIWYNPDNKGQLVTEQLNQEVLDTPLTEGHWYYYTLFVKVCNAAYPAAGEYLAAATATLLVPYNYDHAATLFQMIPPFFQSMDNEQAADGINGPLRRFLSVVGYDLDFTRTLVDGILDVYEPDQAPLMFTQQVGANLGFPVEQALGGARYRSIIGQMWMLENIRGTNTGLQRFIFAACNYNTLVIQGTNDLLTPDDAEFRDGIGHWLAYTNPHVVDMVNPAAGNTHPPNDPFTYLILRPYLLTADSGIQPTDVKPPPEMGQGVLEIIEVGVTSYPGKYGVPGAMVGPSWVVPQTLSQLQMASPPVIPGSVPGYYTAPNPFWAGDYFLLASGEKAYWNGTQWVGGTAPSTGASVRPTLTGMVAGSPGYMQPPGALPPADLAAANQLGASAMVPQVEWQAGDYIVLGDGTQAHPYWYTAQGHPVIGWTTGPGTLSLPASQGRLGPISGYAPKWATSDGSSAIAPSDFTTLINSSPLIIGVAQSGQPDRPWVTNQTYEQLYLYDNTKVYWVGSAWSMPGGSANPYSADWPIKVNTVQVNTGDAFVDSPRAAGTATAATFSTYPILNQAGTTLTQTINPGWQTINYATNNAGFASGVAWTTTDGGNSYSPASAVDCRIHAQTLLDSGNWTAGTVLALFVNGVEHSRATADGNHQRLDHLVTLNVAASDKLSYQIYSPTTQVMRVTKNWNSPNAYPTWRITQTPAIAAASGAWAPQVAGRYLISTVLTPGASTDYGMAFFIMVNGKPVANGYLNNDTSELVRLSVDVTLAVNDRVYLAKAPTYSPSPWLGQITYNSNTPRMTIARWKVAP